MRRLPLSILLVLVAAMAGAQPFNTRIIPSPQRVERAEGFLTDGYAVRHRTVRSIAGATNQQQAYRLIISAAGVEVEYVDLDGYEYAMRTIERLREAWHDSLPCMTLTDWPAYQYRGFLDDVSRGPLPNSEFTTAQLQMAERLELNANTYYTEHTFYSDSMPDLAPLSARHLPTAATHPSVVPNMQCLAHFEKTLASPFYDAIMDSPATLNPAADETYAFLRHRLNEVARANLRAKFFHINADETEALGSGRARSYVDSLGADETYVRHIKRVATMLKRYGYRLLMWGDIVAKQPAMIERLPSYITYIAWSYAPRESYAEVLRPFVEQRAAFWVAASASQSGTIAPDPAAWRENIAYLARDGHKAGAEGFLVTAWDDAGESLFGSSRYAVAWAAEMAWHPIASTNPAEAAAELEARWNTFERNYAQLYDWREAPSYRTLHALRTNPDVAEWYNVPALYADRSTDTARATRVIALTAGIATDSLTPYALYALHRLRLTAEKVHLGVALSAPKGADEYATLSRQFMHNLLSLKREYLHLWDAECTDYWRNVVCDRYDDLGRHVLQAPYRVAIERRGTTVGMSTPSGSTPIYYTLDGSLPSEGSTPYTAPITLSHSTTVRAVAYNQWGEPVYSEQYIPVHAALGAKVALGSAPSSYREAYSAGGTGALTDGLLGSDADYADGHWQGFQGTDIDAAIDLGSSRHVGSISMRFLQYSRDWILAPQTIEVYTSRNGRNWQLVRTEHFAPDYREVGPVVRTCAVRGLDLHTRHLRVVARYAGALPQWHPSAGAPSYLFSDEIIVLDE